MRHEHWHIRTKTSANKAVDCCYEKVKLVRCEYREKKGGNCAKLDGFGNQTIPGLCSKCQKKQDANDKKKLNHGGGKAKRTYSKDPRGPCYPDMRSEPNGYDKPRGSDGRRLTDIRRDDYDRYKDDNPRYAEERRRREDERYFGDNRREVERRRYEDPRYEDDMRRMGGNRDVIERRNTDNNAAYYDANRDRDNRTAIYAPGRAATVDTYDDKRARRPRPGNSMSARPPTYRQGPYDGEDMDGQFDRLAIDVREVRDLGQRDYRGPPGRRRRGYSQSEEDFDRDSGYGSMGPSRQNTDPYGTNEPPPLRMIDSLGKPIVAGNFNTEPEFSNDIKPYSDGYDGPPRSLPLTPVKRQRSYESIVDDADDRGDERRGPPQ